MKLFTQGKTNWKYILIVLILAVVVGGGIFSYRWVSREEVKVPEVKVSEEKKPEELKSTALKVKDLGIKWKGQLECGEVIEWAKVLDIDNDGKKELIVSCSITDKILILKWSGEKFILQGELPKEIEINPWNIYVVRPNDFGSLYYPNRIEFNMIYSPSGGIPWKEKEETTWVRINTFEWDSINKQLQLRTTKSLLGGSSWYLGDINGDGKDELIFFVRPDPEDWDDYSIRIFSWDKEYLIGETNIQDWRPFYAGTQPEPDPGTFVSVADTNNNEIKEIILVDWVGIRDIQYVYLGLEWDGKEFIKFRIDEKMTGKYPQYGVTQYQLKGVGDFDGDGKNELITELLPKKSGEFHLAVFKWNKEENIYEEIFGKILPEYDFLEIGDVNNDGVGKLIFKDKENNLILLSYGDVSEKMVVAGWNTYINEKFRYTINYPEGVFVKIPGSLADNEDTYFYVSHEDSIFVDGQAHIRIQIGQNPENLSLKDWVYSSYNSELKKEGWCIQEFKDTLRLASSCDYHTWEWKHDLISSGTKVVIISTIGSSKKFNLFEISEKMLSTFKFLE